MSRRYETADELPLPTPDQLIEIIIRAAGQADPDGIAAALRLLAIIDKRRCAWTYDAIVLGILIADQDIADNDTDTERGCTLAPHGGHT